MLTSCHYDGAKHLDHDDVRVRAYYEECKKALKLLLEVLQKEKPQKQRTQCAVAPSGANRHRKVSEQLVTLSAFQTGEGSTQVDHSTHRQLPARQPAV